MQVDDPRRTDDDRLEEAGEESFPASDPLSANPLHAGQPRRESADSARRGGAAGEHSLAALPTGYVSQTMWGFHDPPERYAYDLQYVYGPPSRTDRRGQIANLDKGRSYWQRTPIGSFSAEPHPIEESISYAQACRRWGRRFTFEHFASIPHMRARLPEAFGR